jgi:hypothetical protein
MRAVLRRAEILTVMRLARLLPGAPWYLQQTHCLKFVHGRRNFSSQQTIDLADGSLGVKEASRLS